MNKALLFNFIVDKEIKEIKVERSFNAPVDLVWAAWTEADILDQWWAPKPYRAVTESMNFSEGGRWHYYILSPEGEKQWCLFDFEFIRPLKQFSGIDAFCNENAVTNNTKPRVKWNNIFNKKENKTVVNIQLQFEALEDLETIIKMGFKEGFTMALGNLDELISDNKENEKVKITNAGFFRRI
jgi:uncharacterized protein YndB with AHSA1/START domain